MKVLLFFLTIALLWVGGQALYTTVTNLSPTEISIVEYVEKRPSKKWLHLQGCQLDLSEASYFSSAITSAVNEVFIPVTPIGADGEGKVTVLLATKDREVIDLVNTLKDMEDETQIMAFALQNMDRLVQERDVAGLVRFGIDLDDGDAREMERLNPNLAEDFVILDEGSRPEWWLIAMLPIGLVVGYFLIFGLPKRSAPPQINVPPSLPPGS